LKRFLRRWWPWLVGAAILVAIIARVPFAAFRDALTHGPHHWMALFEIAITSLVLATETFATWVGLAALRMRRSIADLFFVRGATYLLFVINYALAQGAFGVYLHRTGVSPRPAVGATLFLMGVNVAALLLLTSVGWALDGSPVPAGLWWTLTVGGAGLALYLAVILVAPGPLARVEWLAPLFASGVRGHALGIAARIPHVVGIVLSQWLAMRVWGIDVPASAVLTIVPAIAVAAALPIAPGGMGTMQAAAVYFFSDYAPGATADERAAAVLAFSVVHLVWGLVAVVVVGLPCIPRARRAGVIKSAP
jgi:hypothetical protein